jgi:hypothetical protein
MNASWFNGSDDRDWPSSDGTYSVSKERLAYQNVWLEERRLTRKTWTTKDVIAEQSDWRAGKSPIPAEREVA